MPITRDRVRTYYEQNTELFIRFGNARRAQNIHRGLWTDGVRTVEEALNISNERIRDEIECVAPTHARVTDLGCGVGASLFHIFPRLAEPNLAIGVTLSPLQARLAGRAAKQMSFTERIDFVESDFTCLPLAAGCMDAAFAVEAVAHAIDPESVFCEASRLLRTGGLWIVLDDYRVNRALTSAEEKWLDAFIHGWHVPGVITTDQAETFASRNRLRLIRNDDFTPLLRLQNLPDTLARLLRFLGNHLPIQHAILPSMLGSMALQQCLHDKIIEYRFLVFEKV